MKKIYWYLALLFFIPNVLAQKVKDEKVRFESIRLPLQPLPLSVKNYQITVVAEYESEVQAKRDAYNTSVAEAGKRYAKDMEIYNKMTQAQKAQTPAPVMIMPLEDYYPKVYSGDQLATNMALDGFQKSAGNAVMITVFLKGLQFKEPEMKTEKAMVKQQNGTSVSQTVYTYKISYRHPVEVKVEVPGRGVILQEYVEATNMYKDYTTPKYNSENELYNAFNKNTFLAGVEDKLIQENIRVVNEYLNNKFGYSKIRNEVEINIAEGSKKYRYPEFQQAYEAVITGANQLASDPDKSVASQNLRSALDIWENVLRDAQPYNKKARINGEVTMGTYFNLARVAILANDYSRAEIYINKIIASDPSKREQRRAEELRAHLNDEKARFEARAILR